MSLWTREELLELISRWKAAYKAVSHGQSYSIDGRSLTYLNVTEIRAQLSYLQGELESLRTGSGSLRHVKCRTVR
ncbi:hypothetical protein [uncultured Desulfovibrio sp.]|uniref:hypothetical protein n=1 Tax=uncultured Desulfovibrio sp. TaxID=167968 RepID=UPI002601659E|nr:hypothetical protein [uncultured Desulfovibrio sp.]